MRWKGKQTVNYKKCTKSNFCFIYYFHCNSSYSSSFVRHGSIVWKKKKQLKSNPNIKCCWADIYSLVIYRIMVYVCVVQFQFFFFFFRFLSLSFLICFSECSIDWHSSIFLYNIHIDEFGRFLEKKNMKLYFAVLLSLFIRQ